MVKNHDDSKKISVSSEQYNFAENEETLLGLSPIVSLSLEQPRCEECEV